jgi:hypothetical protein
MHAMGSRLLGFTQELFDDTADVGPQMQAVMLREMADKYPSITEIVMAITHDHRHFTTGPVVGFVAEDLPAAVAELEQAGVKLLGGHVDERGVGCATSARPTATCMS